MYCLYQHKDPITLKCVYIGMGSEKRMNKTIQRNSLYLSYFKEQKPKIELIRKFEDKKEASRAECNIINLMRPILNIKKTGYKESKERRAELAKSHGGGMISVYRGEEYIGTYGSSTLAAEALNILPSGIRNVLCGLAKTTKGFTIVKEVQ